MAFIDDIIIKVRGGKGGDGAKSFHVNFGSMRRSPDGGNGGNGGNVYFEGTHNLDDLNEFRFKKDIKAGDGINGQHKNLIGKTGEDITVLVPLGTTIIDSNTNESLEITENGQRELVAKGGRKGLGNHDYRIDKKNFTPRREMGEAGEEREIHLILNLIADIGFIGFPNAGKSSLLTALTQATPKIGNYPFTTLEPNLGTMVFQNPLDDFKKNDRIVIADIPGLVEGAHKGKGLGLKFLKHIRKTKILLHLIDSTSEDVMKSYKTVISEFEDYDKSLLLKKEVILLTKTDLIDDKKNKVNLKKLSKINKKILTVSIYDEKSLNDLKKEIFKEITELKD